LSASTISKPVEKSREPCLLPVRHSGALDDFIICGQITTLIGGIAILEIQGAIPAARTLIIASSQTGCRDSDNLIIFTHRYGR